MIKCYTDAPHTENISLRLYKTSNLLKNQISIISIFFLINHHIIIIIKFKKIIIALDAA